MNVCYFYVERLVCFHNKYKAGFPPNGFTCDLVLFSKMETATSSLFWKLNENSVSTKSKLQFCFFYQVDTRNQRQLRVFRYEYIHKENKILGMFYLETKKRIWDERYSGRLKEYTYFQTLIRLLRQKIRFPEIVYSLFVYSLLVYLLFEIKFIEFI